MSVPAQKRNPAQLDRTRLDTTSLETTNSAGLLDELQETLAHGPIARRVNALRQVTDLFLVQAVDYSREQVGLFDDVFLCLIERIEESAKASLAVGWHPSRKRRPASFAPLPSTTASTSQDRY